MARLYGREWTRRELEARVGRIEQLGGVQPFVMREGRRPLRKYSVCGPAQVSPIGCIPGKAWISLWLNSAVFRLAGLPATAIPTLLFQGRGESLAADSFRRLVDDLRIVASWCSRSRPVRSLWITWTNSPYTRAAGCVSGRMARR